MPPPRHQGGFSLLEVLVAFAILGLALGVLMNIFSTALRGVTLGEQYSKAALLADARLAALGSETPIESGSQSGNEGDPEDIEYRWRLTIAPYGEADQFQAPGEMELFQVTLTVNWSEGDKQRRIDVDTLRLATGEGR